MQRIIEEIRSEVNKICEQYKETTNDDCSKHIHAVVAISEQLADKFNADKEIVVLGAYLHDVSCPAQYGSLDEHHIYSSQLAEKMLNKKNYPKERTERVIKCVLHHRGSKMEVKETIEEECVADADAISHFYDIPGLFHVAYNLKSLSEEDGIEWVRRKLNSDFQKLSQRSRELYKSKYNSIMQSVFSEQ